MKENQPYVVLVGGPNGAGKSTVAPELINSLFGITEFINADTIARGFSFEPENVSIAAGRLMLNRMKELSERKQSFAFETTLAAKIFGSFLESLKANGYRINILFFWIPSAEFAKARVSSRVQLGGHSVPAKTIERRYASGLSNFFSIYQPVCDVWQIYDNSRLSGPQIIAGGRGRKTTIVKQTRIWTAIKKEYA